MLQDDLRESRNASITVDTFIFQSTYRDRGGYPAAHLGLDSAQLDIFTDAFTVFHNSCLEIHIQLRF